jgi:dipeptidyl aminopeptidase/acylaminoacyl peptidase
MGKPLPEATQEYERFSPRHRLEALSSAPKTSYLIIHGDQDRIVHHNQSDAFVAALRKKNAAVETLLVPGAGHHWFTLADDNPARRRVDQEPNTSVAPVLLEFLEKRL